LDILIVDPHVVKSLWGCRNWCWFSSLSRFINFGWIFSVLQ